MVNDLKYVLVGELSTCRYDRPIPLTADSLNMRPADAYDQGFDVFVDFKLDLPNDRIYCLRNFG
jgi:hypothetical protein